MNLLLFHLEDLDPKGLVTLRDRRAQHLCGVLGVTPGKQLRAGLLGQGHGHAEVLEVRPNEVTLRYRAGPQEPAPPNRVLLLAIPRPKVLARCVEHAAALGFTRLGLLRTARVDKAHLSSHKLEPERLRRHLLLGLEQSCRVHLPSVSVFPRFRPFVEDALDAWAETRNRVIAHPTAVQTPRELELASTDYALALGPEGGFVPFEVSLLERQGFIPVSAPTGPLRVESALSYFTGQLDLRAPR